jgi:thiol-disulfide isomerase/thioredoxin
MTETRYVPLEHGGLETALRDGRDKLIAVVFYATWCPSCADYWATLREVSDEVRERTGLDTIIYGVDAEDDVLLARRMRVTAVPTTLFYSYEIRVREMVGARPAYAILEDLDGTLSRG